MSDWSQPPQAFTAGHVSALTGLSDRQLRYWDNRGLFQPAYADDNRQTGDIGKIGRHRYVAHNADVLAGTRIPTAAIWDSHQAGYDTAGILSQYPTIRACQSTTSGLATTAPEATAGA